MKKIIKITAIVLSLLLTAFCFASCGDKASEETDDKTEKTSSAKSGGQTDEERPDGNAYKKLYLDIINEKEKDINAYFWQFGCYYEGGEADYTEYNYWGERPKQIVVYDLFGDETPELMFAAGESERGSGWQSTVSIYSVNNGQAEQVASFPFDAPGHSGAPEFFPDADRLIYLDENGMIRIVSQGMIEDKDEQIMNMSLSEISVSDPSSSEKEIAEISFNQHIGPGQWIEEAELNGEASTIEECERYITASLVGAKAFLLSNTENFAGMTDFEQMDLDEARAFLSDDGAAENENGAEESEDAPDSLEYEMKEETIEIRSGDGSITGTKTVEYPVFSGDDQTSRTLNEYYSKRLSDEYTSYLYEEDPELNDGACFELHAAVTYNKNGYVSILNDFYEYYGNGHPTAYQDTLTYRLSDSEEIILGDVFGSFLSETRFLNISGSQYGSLFGYGEPDSPFSLTDDGVCIYYPGPAVTDEGVVIPYLYSDVMLAK